MGVKLQRVATITGGAEVDHAIATLVLAFATDPVARWMYADPHQYLLHVPRLSEPSEEARLKREQRSAPATVLGSRYGCHLVFTAMMGRWRLLSQVA